MFDENDFRAELNIFPYSPPAINLLGFVFSRSACEHQELCGNQELCGRAIAIGFGMFGESSGDSK